MTTSRAPLRRAIPDAVATDYCVAPAERGPPRFTGVSFMLREMAPKVAPRVLGLPDEWGRVAESYDPWFLRFSNDRDGEPGFFCGTEQNGPRRGNIRERIPCFKRIRLKWSFRLGDAANVRNLQHWTVVLEFSLRLVPSRSGSAGDKRPSDIRRGRLTLCLNPSRGINGFC